MMDQEKVKNFMALLVDETQNDRILWRNTMCNIYETVFYREKILTDWERDEPPMISIGGGVLQGRGLGIEHLRGVIDEQFRRQKRGRYSKEAETAEQATKILSIVEKVKNAELVSYKIDVLLRNPNTIVCTQCGGSVSLLARKVARAMGASNVLCKTCNPHAVEIPEDLHQKLEKFFK